MPSQNKTTNYGLNQWQGNEYVKRQDFVEDNSIIDAALTPQADPAKVPSSNGPFKMVDWVSYFTNRMKSITGKANWWDGPTKSLEQLNSDVTLHLAENASTTGKGHVQLNNTVTSTSTTQAATANAVKTAYDLANEKISKTGDNINRNLTGWANAVNNDENNYVNKRIFGATNNNNGLFIIGDGTTNARRFGIQSGHSSTAYASATGILELNPFGGEVRINGNQALHKGNESSINAGSVGGYTATQLLAATNNDGSFTPMPYPTANAITILSGASTQTTFTTWFTINGSFNLDILRFAMDTGLGPTEFKVIIDGSVVAYCQLQGSISFEFMSSYAILNSWMDNYGAVISKIPARVAGSSGSTSIGYLSSIHYNILTPISSWPGSSMIASSQNKTFVFNYRPKVNSSLSIQYKAGNNSSVSAKNLYYSIGGTL
ncbi:hypothetical protein HNQ80_003626 [Anaerosolibacter carboniphilus]|uniref:Tail fiber protein n=1 Tax=Anaerosolibacter carboniphilus TaxID=1417629 RepID=A0A841L5B6_9FIRM|nr:tail fiber protein [Anaerosolibacter carboniphilus]MBB6217505.1 hypothetical protein [Anaerosolibacter carboniphilus]